MEAERDSGGVYVIPSGGAETQQLPPNLGGRLDNVEGLTKTILTVVVVSVGAMIVSLVIGLAALILDQQHFNNEFYREAAGQPIKTATDTKTVVKPVFVKSPLASQQ